MLAAPESVSRKKVRGGAVEVSYNIETSAHVIGPGSSKRRAVIGSQGDLQHAC
jgi:hypothetical protein